jgi:hypothetical protein
MTENPPPAGDDDGEGDASLDADGDASHDGDRDASHDGDRDANHDADADAIRDGDREGRFGDAGDGGRVDESDGAREGKQDATEATDAEGVDASGDEGTASNAESVKPTADETADGDTEPDEVAVDEATADETADGDTEPDEVAVDEATADETADGDVDESAPFGGVDPRATAVNTDGAASPGVPDESNLPGDDEVPPDVQKYARFKKMDGAQYERVNEFLRERTYVTAREWAIARLCADFRTETGVEMTKIGENLPELVPFMTDTYTPQAVNQARASFEEKVRKAGATFLYGAMCDFFTAEELDDVMYESTEVAKFLLEVEGVDLSVDEELDAEERISSVMREVRSASEELRED